jgi:RNA polymerase sigma-70 factor (ECF subfamily)
MLNNRQFKRLIASGDQKQFGQSMEITSNELLLFATGFLKNKENSEEILSDVYVNIRNIRGQIESIVNLRSYLFICVRNGCLLHLRKVKNDKIISIDSIGYLQYNQFEGPEDSNFEKETIEQIYTAIKALPPKCKLAFTLAKINGLKYKEIAEMFGITKTTVNNHLVRKYNINHLKLYISTTSN